MSYESVKLARTPVAWYPNDELTGTEMTDFSGNDEHQTYLDLDHPTDPVLLGQASGVETVATSRSVYTPGQRVANWAVTAPFDSRVNFTWEVLIRQTADLLSVRTLVARGNNRLQLAATEPFRATFVVEIGVDDFTVQSSNSLLLNSWYHIFGIRNGATLTLIVNGQVANSRGDLPASTPINIPGSDFIAYGSTSGGIDTLQMLGNMEELTFYDYALTSAQALEIYESMIASIFLNGYSNVTPSAVLYSDVEPDPISYPFRHNWVDDWIERFSFATGISTARKGYEQANAQRVKPRREIEITQVLKDDYERRMFRAKLNANQHRKWFFPILDHRDRLTGVIASGVSVFAVDTLYKDYEVGGYFGLRQLNDAGRITHWEELLITGLTDTQITTATTTVNSYTNPEAYPVRRAIIQQSQSLRGHTDSVEETTITARLIAEDEKSAPHRIVEFTPATTYKSHEVFPVDEWPNNWAELRDYEVTRIGEEVDFATGPFVIESDAIAASETLSWRIILQTLQQQAEFLGWFYAHAGSLTYLWVPTIQRDFEVVSSGLSTVTVSGHNYFENYAVSEFRRDVAFVYNDNSVILRRIASVVLSGANEVLQLDANTPTLTNLRSLSYLLFCRLDNDTLERAAVTDSKARFSWLFREILSSPA